MAIQMGIGILVQTLYFFTDLYFVSKIGDTAIAGVSSAGNIWFVVLALTQILNVGTVALVSNAVGAQQRDRANLVFNQSLAMSLILGVVVIVGVYASAGPYMRAIAANDATARAGIDYLYWFAPGLGLQFAMIAMFATLRGTGIVKPTMILQIISVLLNVVLAPVLIAGWGRQPMGPAGGSREHHCHLRRCGAERVLLSSPREVRRHSSRADARAAAILRRSLYRLAGGLEFFLMSIVMGVIYRVIRDWRRRAGRLRRGAGRDAHHHVARDGRGVCRRADAGQNFGARRPERVRETFKWTVTYSVVIMLLLTALCQFESQLFVHIFTTEAAVVAVGCSCW